MKGTNRHYRAVEKEVQHQLDGQFVSNEDVQKTQIFFGLGLIIALLNGILIGSLVNKK